jgi:hypothetical protein
MASGFLVLSSAVGLPVAAALLGPQLTALHAAETSTGGSVAPVSAEAADQTGLKKGTTTIDKKSPADGSKELLATAKLEGCKSQFKLADQNGDGLLDQSEIAHYNSSIEHENQAPLPENDRLNEADFIAACSAVGARE